MVHKKICFILLLFMSLIGLAAYLVSTSATNNVAEQDKEGWVRYVDTDYGFALSHPVGLDENISYPDEKTGFGVLDKSISFDATDFGVMGVKVYTQSPFDTLDALWKSIIKESQEGFVGEAYIREDDISFDGIPGIVYHPAVRGPEGEIEQFVSQKRVLVIKDGVVFEIWSRFGGPADYEEALESVMFLEQRG